MPNIETSILATPSDNKLPATPSHAELQTRFPGVCSYPILKHAP